MAKVFDEILLKGVRSGKIPAKTQEARDWYREQAKKTGKLNETKLIREDRDRLKNVPTIGSMFMYAYDPKWKDKLPYYDRFPLIFPFRKTKKGFYGINLHYLPLPLRAKLMDSLHDLANNTKYDESTKLKINYQILNGAARFKHFKPCVKQYLNAHVRTKPYYIFPSEWDICLFLPLERFAKAPKSKVWSDSRKIIRGVKP